MYTIGFFLFEDVEELDWVGPWEVLASWAARWPDDGISCSTVSRDGGPVRCAKGTRVLVDHAWDTAPAYDLLIYPGGQGTRAQLGDAAIREWVRRMKEEVDVLASVCTGSLALADAGLLDGRPATTHWRSIERLGTLGEAIDVRAEERFVDDGDIVTASGISAGIDMALHLVARLHSVERAREVRRAIQYDPAPPV
ncbi:DJ-1/PfpI family protein [Egibacter rhizosphaerae]|uniref:DJ-1/PfpI family protein n=1 Tax=Egibacter rhizosphaerae TaxID=1670831 RepID=A0A411YJX3_9ACTN|nr:DJ-1/PfpI family protein [Egibacter rhizosphaerae]QBI21487.1 DJ-1/PfpI family protein [Egibacter rhizosphaerae]